MIKGIKKVISIYLDYWVLFHIRLCLEYSDILPLDFPHKTHNNLAFLLYFYLWCVPLPIVKFLHQHQHGSAAGHGICST